MTLKEVGDQLESYIPPRYAESWDNVGWMVGPLSETLTGVLLCVDASKQALDRAIDLDHNLVMSHHPLIFEPLPRLVDSSPHHRLVMKAVRNGIGVYSVHTNADSMSGGLNDLFADVLRLQDTSPLRPMEEEPAAGIGRRGVLESPRSLETLERDLRDRFELTHTQTLGEASEPVERVAVCTGSGGEFIGPELADQVDLYITGDVDHHEAMEAQAYGLSLMILDHYEMETIFLPFARSLWQEQFGDQYPVETFRRKNPYRHRL